MLIAIALVYISMDMYIEQIRKIAQKKKLHWKGKRPQKKTAT